MAVALVTDSTHYLPRSVLAEHGIHEVSLYVTRGAEVERESAITDLDDFYARLASERDLPTTSQPSIGDFLAVYEPLLADGRDVVSIHLSGELSGTVESARQAAEIAGGASDRDVTVLDSRGACGALGMVLLAAAAAARAGEDAYGVVARAEAAMVSQRFWFGVDSLEFLRRGGRIGRAQAWMGGALRIKPILNLDDGLITPVERVRTSRRLFERMTEFLHEMQDAGVDGWCVQHIQAPDQEQRMYDAGRELFGTEPVLRGEIGPVIGSHVGPGLFGVGGLPRDIVA